MSTRSLFGQQFEMVNPRVDIAFKKLFGAEENKDLLISLLNSIISESDQIDQVELLNPYNDRDFRNDKLSILDIKAKNKHTGTYFLIEMQLSNEGDYSKRGLYGWARSYAGQIKKGGQYQDLCRTIAIHVLNFNFIDYNKIDGWEAYSPNKYHHRFILSDKDTKLSIFKDMEIHTIELSKFEAIDDKDLDSVMKKVKGSLDVWVALLTKYDLLEQNNLPKKMDIPEVQKALQVMCEMNMNQEERELYNNHLDFLRMEYSTILKATNDALEEGIIIGKKEGKLEGKLEEKMEIVRNLLALGVSIELVAKSTGLSEEEVRELGLALA